MIVLLNGPYWFRGADVFFGLIYILVTLMIAALSYKAYKLTEEKKYSYFSIAFLFLGISYLIYSVTNGILITHVSGMLNNVLNSFDYAFLIYMFLTFVAYIILLIITLKIEQKKVMLLLFALAFLFMLFSYQHYLKFHLVSFIFLFFLTHQFYTNYLEKKNRNAKLVFTAFYLLTCAQIFFIAITYSLLFYVLAASLQLVGFMLLAYMFMRINYGRTKGEA
ncbi:hypothetical protein HZA98_03160 [Candidatus Woesearchaeota archaeon]|nr:hypothetical protein [Candidatus Woesearchaeota archaeon]